MIDLLGWENWRNWTDQFEQKHTSSWTQEEILERVQRLERRHWTWSVLGIVLSALGGGFVAVDPAVGCLGLIVGSLLVIGTKLASSNALCTYHILWDIRKCEDEAVLKSEIQDL